MSISPTSKINTDCLLLICETITQQVPDPSVISIGRDTGRPLNDIRAVSQVCYRWRELLLTSPWIWGRVIDLDIGSYSLPNYRQKRGEWMEEVLKRAGSAPLWITGDVGYFRKPVVGDGTFDSLSFFIKLLESWERIEILSVTIIAATVMEVPDALQTRFFSRAPILKHFEVLWPDWHEAPVFQCSPSRRLFSNYAPALRTMNDEYLPFTIDSPWLSGIREMVPIPTALTISEVIILLRQMPLLQKFQLAHCFSASDLVAPQPTLRLPNLTSIILTTSLASTAKIMGCLSTGRLSSLTVEIDVEDYGPKMMDANPVILSAFKNALARYISNYFASRSSTNIRVKAAYKWHFSFDDISKDGGSSQRQKLDVRLGCYGLFSDRDTRDVILSILDAIPVASTLGGNPDAKGLFDSIDDMTLDLVNAPLDIFPNFRSMLGVFHRIRLIRINNSSVANFLSVCVSNQTGGGGECPAVLFPGLHTFCLGADTPRGYVSDADFTSLAVFLLERKKMGYPLARLDLTDFPQSDEPDLERLEEVEGLEVVWKQITPDSRDRKRWEVEVRSYVCGSGNPKGAIAPATW